MSTRLEVSPFHIVLKLFDPEGGKDDSSVSDKLKRIMRVNSIKLTNRMTNKTNQNLYLRISRINHSCRPNSVWKPDVNSNGCGVVSLATIEKNEEITCSRQNSVEASSIGSNMSEGQNDLCTAL